MERVNEALSTVGRKHPWMSVLGLLAVWVLWVKMLPLHWLTPIGNYVDAVAEASFVPLDSLSWQAFAQWRPEIWPALQSLGFGLLFSLSVWLVILAVILAPWWVGYRYLTRHEREQES